MKRSHLEKEDRRFSPLTLERLEERATPAVMAVAGDWNGDGVETAALFDNSTNRVFIRNDFATGTATSIFSVPGLPTGTLAVAGDWNNDGIDTLGFFDPAAALFYIKNSNTAAAIDQVFAFGGAGMLPVAGDWNGDGFDTIGLFNQATGDFFLRNSLTAGAADITVNLGFNGAGVLPVAGDWNGDNFDTLGAYQQATSTFNLQDANVNVGTILISFNFGAANSTPLGGDWNNDNITTVGVYQPTNQIVITNVTSAAPPAAAAFTINTSSTVVSPGNTGVTYSDPTINASQVQKLLKRAVAASKKSRDAIIAIVDRAGRIVGVHVGSRVLARIPDMGTLIFAIDGAVAKARTAAYFSSNSAPLTSRTVRFISQSTVTQREVQSNPNVADIMSPFRGPGFVAPIGLGGHFPPDVRNTPPVDLFAIEHTNRDSLLHPGLDGIKGTGDDIFLPSRFNIDPSFYASGAALFAPESYGYVTGLMPNAQSRGIATMPGGVPLYFKKKLVGGIGVFFPGFTGTADFEQGFKAGKKQSTLQRVNSKLALEAEWIAFAAAGGTTSDPINKLGSVGKASGFRIPLNRNQRIDLVGITLEIIGPTPTRANPQQGIDTILAVGRRAGRINSGMNGVDLPVDTMGSLYLDGEGVPEGWIVTPHDGVSLSAGQVEQMISNGIAEANNVRAAIRLPLSSRTRMVFAVADVDGNVLGIYRMPDATVFSIDVAVAKARNTAYYADATALVEADRVPGVPAGTAFTNRTFRFLAEPRYPSGVDGSVPPVFSILTDPGINPNNGYNLGPALPASVYSSNSTSVLGFDAFNVGRNFRDPDNIANQNGIVFFPGSSAIYVGATLSGGLGVSGDGVDQDDVVTFAAQRGFEAPFQLRADNFIYRGSRLPYQKFLRNPRG